MASLAPQSPEILIGLVGAIGTDLLTVANILADSLNRFSYSSSRLHLIDELLELRLPIGRRNLYRDTAPDRPYEVRAKALMDLGNAFCKKLDFPDAVARLAVMAVGVKRKSATGDARTAAPRTAYIISSLKRPDEVERLRQVYGRAFFLVSVYTDERKRLEALANRIAKSRGEARADRYLDKALALITRDEQDIAKFGAFGQNVQGTFHRADVFVNAGDVKALRSQLDRFVSLVLGDPRQTPLQDEFGMYLAQAAALRSGDPSRQVGASLVNDELLVLGACRRTGYSARTTTIRRRRPRAVPQ